MHYDIRPDIDGSLTSNALYASFTRKVVSKCDLVTMIQVIILGGQ